MTRTASGVALAIAAAAALVPRSVVAQASAPETVARPGQESGRLDGEREEPDEALFTRAVLAVPRLAVKVVLSPVRGMVYLVDRYHVPERARRWFFNRDETYGAFPIVGWDSGYGPTGGVKLVAREVFGDGESASAKAAIGLSGRRVVQARVTSGDRLGEHVEATLEGRYERNPNERFFGLGNGDEVLPPEMLIDPTIDNRAVDTRFNQRRARLAGIVDVGVVGDLHLRPGLMVADVELSSDIGGSSSRIPIDEAFDVMTLPGYPGYQVGYAELELRYDSRDHATAFESAAMPSRGWLLSLYGGRATTDATPDYWRYGTDIQRLFHLGEGPRALATRLHVEAVSGQRDEVPFTELPVLGGPSFLRGYPIERFRDRVAAVASVEYSWDLAESMGASLFVDAGRTYAGFDEVTVEDLRVGYGLGVQWHTQNLLLARAQLASSIDGGLFFNLAFEPAFEPTPRVRRR